MPPGIYKRKPSIERFFENIEKSENCWIWLGKPKNNGYGQIQVNKEKWYAHRYSFVLHFRALKKGEVVCHKCDNPICVNPEHLFVGTQADNLADMCKKGRHVSVSKFTPAQILDIRKQYENGIKNAELCKQFNTTHSTIARIVHRKLHKNI